MIPPYWLKCLGQPLFLLSILYFSLLGLDKISKKTWDIMAGSWCNCKSNVPDEGSLNDHEQLPPCLSSQASTEGHEAGPCSWGWKCYINAYCSCSQWGPIYLYSIYIFFLCVSIFSSILHIKIWLIYFFYSKRSNVYIHFLPKYTLSWMTIMQKLNPVENC